MRDSFIFGSQDYHCVLAVHSSVLDEAVQVFNKSLTEHRNADTPKKLNNTTQNKEIGNCASLQAR